MAAMSKKSGSLELSEFFNNEDSNGDRLAEYLQKRCGGARCQNFLFDETETLRWSVNVQLEKLPAIVQNDANDQAEESAKGVQSQPPNIIQEKCEEDVQPEDAGDAAKVVGVGGSANSQENIGEPAPPLSPRLAAIRKSGGVSPSDRLRRLSLKRLWSGRRTLLQDFENTLTDSAFTPQIYSTPLSQVSTSDNRPTNVENIAPSASQVENRHPNEGSTSWATSPAKSLKNTEENLRRIMSIFETTLKNVQSKNNKDEESEKTTQKKNFEVEPDRSSALRRTYTLEKGQKPGQVILTPEVVLSPKSNSMDISGFLRQSQVHDSSRRATRTPERRSNSTNVLGKSLGSTNRCSHIGGEVGNANITQLFENRSAELEERDVNLCDHISAAKDLSDMDITPLVNHVSQNVALSHSSNKVHRTSQRLRNRSQITICFDNSHVACSPGNRVEKRNLIRNRSSVMVNRSRCGGVLSSSNINYEAGTTTPPAIPINQRELSYDQHATKSAVGEEELVIPETQDQRAQGRTSIVIESPNHQVPFVVLPVSQTFHETLQNESNNAVDQACDAGDPASAVGNGLCCSTIIGKTKSNPNKSHIPNATINDDHSDTDNLKLADILTDDEDEPSYNTMSETNKSCNSQVPLNLAGGASSYRMTRLRKRSISRRRLQNSVSGTTDAETLPLSLSNHAPNRKRSIKRRQMTLNKAPGTPLNGEAFAKELARMSNYEILDLRKRNSMGRIFAISGRNSLREKDQSAKNAVKLDDEIEMELLRRNLQMANDIIHTTEATLTDIHNKANDIGGEEEVYPPAPKEFSDSMSLRREEESSLLDEKSCDRISFRTRRETTLKKRKNGSSVPDVLQHYLKVSEKFTKKKKKKRRSVNHTKRSLYTGGFSDSEETICNSSIEKNAVNNPTMTSLPYVPSPPRLESDQMPPLRVVSPPPPLSLSLENLHRTGADKSGDETPTPASSPKPSKPPTPPTHFETDSGMETNSSSQSHQTALGVAGDGSADNVFKKPLPPPPLQRKKTVRMKKKDRLESITLNSGPTMSETSSDTPVEGELRRSKRGHVPLKNQAPLFQVLFQQVINKQFKSWEKRNAKDKQKLLQNSRANIVDNRSLGESSSTSNSTALPKRRKRLDPVPETAILENAPTKGESSGTSNSTALPKRRKRLPTVSETVILENEPTKAKKKSKKVIAQGTHKSDTLECSHISLATPAPLNHFNNVFDHLRNTSQIDERPSEKETQKLPHDVQLKTLRVRVARVKTTQDPKKVSKNTVTTAAVNNISHTPQQIAPENSSTVSSTNDTKQSSFELISWLKNITEAENTSRNEEIFKEMRISSASNLCFTELQGVEYAFYDTDDKASLGYLRFKPRQIKTRKRAKRYHLHFVTLVGSFRITANDKESVVGPGDMVAIEKSVYYDIENISDDIGILMVIKK